MPVEAVLPYPVGVGLWTRSARALGADPDAAEVVRFRAGEEDAFEALVSRREREVYNLARRLLRDREDALDATQDTFLRVFRSLSSFRGDCAFRTWVFGIAINVCRSRLASAEARQRRATASLERDDHGEARELPLPDPAPGPESAAVGGELRLALERALQRLTPEHREIVLLREMEGLEYDDLARLLGCAVGTVKSRLARARAALRTELEGVWP